jgi:hypothetical protein
MYTNHREFFGMHPVKAMHLGCLVLACNDGSSLEQIEHEYSGFLLPAISKVWGAQLQEIICSPD